MTARTFRCGRGTFGSGRALVIAEAGVNHNGSLSRALELVDVARDANADAIKFQTFVPSKLVARHAGIADYQRKNLGVETTQLDMLSGLALGKRDFEEIARRCDRRGIMFLSTPFDEESADMLATLGVPAFKTPSGELTNHPLLQHIAALGRPMIISTGMATLPEVREALGAVRAVNATLPLVVLHCTSDYPASPRDVNLLAMATMAEAFDVPVGYSDHTVGLEVPIAAAALGAAVIEKHFTLDRSLPGPDHKASIEPTELKQLVSSIRIVEEALGSGNKEPTQAELETARVARKSLVAARALPSGTVLSADDLVSKRPGTGISPSRVGEVLGRVLSRSLAADEVLSLEDLRQGG
ncbi:MAG: N-acetylneuraminate synthase [Candidatus Eisenbacteria bacterium]|nr:N-acetylneuraminate synthase [Candidatus Eisenbacteria bacterium]